MSVVKMVIESAQNNFFSQEKAVPKNRKWGSPEKEMEKEEEGATTGRPRTGKEIEKDRQGREEKGPTWHFITPWHS